MVEALRTIGENLLSNDLGSILLFFTLPWVIFSLLSTISDVCVGYLDEFLLRKLGANDEAITIDAPGQLILISGLFGLVVSLGAFLLVTVSPHFHFALSVESFLNGFGAGVLEALWLIPYFYALDKGNALQATPLFQTVPIFSLIFGLLFFGEVPATIYIIATLFIMTGAFLLNYSPAMHRLNYPTLVLMLLASSIISMGYFLFKDAAEIGNFISALFSNGLGMGTLSIAIWVLWRPYREQFFERIRTFDLKIIILQTANEGLYAISAIFNQLAIVLGPTVMVVSAMNAFHPVFTLCIGAGLARFGLPQYSNDFAGVGKHMKIAAIIAIAIGTVLIAR